MQAKNLIKLEGITLNRHCEPTQWAWQSIFECHGLPRRAYSPPRNDGNVLFMGGYLRFTLRPAYI